ITRRSAWDNASATGLSLVAYSSAALVSCTEQGPTTTRSRASLPSRIASMARRVSQTLVDAVSVRGISSASIAGASNGRVLTMRRSSVFMARLPAMTAIDELVAMTFLKEYSTIGNCVKPLTGGEMLGQAGVRYVEAGAVQNVELVFRGLES